ncbi:hypothetical protein F4809DRAFT_566635 [Biscogniauxia mediterranea]|nr:hypothetical protein F4809DRAFT_566635 [Biscogniauxia mediterranea]
MDQERLLYQCCLCNGRFKAIYELEEHMMVHGPDHQTPPHKKTRVSRPRSTPRAMQACQACALSKTKCDNDRQCKRCRKRKKVCIRTFGIETYGEPVKEAHGSTDSRATPPATVSIAKSGVAEAETIITTPLISKEYDSHDLEEHNNGDQSHLPFGHQNTMDGGNKNNVLLNPETSGQVHLGDPEETQAAVIPHSGWDLTLLQDYFNFNQDNNVQYTDFLTSLPAVVNFDEEINHLGATPESDDSISPVLDQYKSRVVKDAFTMTVGRWIPPARDLQADEEKALLTTQGANITTTETLSFWDSEFMPDGFPQAARDRLLIMIVNACDSEDSSQIAANFPSCTNLCRLARSFLAWHANQDATWIHIPTFNVSEVRIELLAAIIAGGALRSPSRAVQKFGLALHELLAVQLRKASQISNILTRDLQYLQAFTLRIQIALLSGDKRKMEIAVGASGNLVNMLRAGGRYRRFTYAPVSPQAGDGNTSLEARWKDWVEQESFIRLVYQVHIICGNESIMNSISSCLSYNELSLRFPGSRQLWLAKSAVSWKEMLQSQVVNEPAPHISILDCLADLSHLGRLPCYYDTNLARISVLYGILTIVRNYREGHTITEASSPNSVLSRESVLMDDSQHRWLLKVFENLKQTLRVYHPSTKLPPAVLLMIELLQIHFYASIEQMELLAGKEGFEEAKMAYSSLQRWVRTRDARQCIWHTAQLLRIAQSISSDTTTDFSSVAVYHVSLCLWTYGTITSKMSPGDDAVAQPIDPALTESDDILLDGEETVATQRWISFGCGRPVLTNFGLQQPTSASQEPRLPLRATEALMNMCIETIRHKYPTGTAIPPTSESLCHLVRALGSTAKGGKMIVCESA